MEALDVEYFRCLWMGSIRVWHDGFGLVGKLNTKLLLENGLHESSSE
jgi:hypothetical protein